jgi:hypothetical protein
MIGSPGRTARWQESRAIDALCSIPAMLATHATASPARNEALVWLALLLGLTIVGFIAIMLLRRWYRGTTSPDGAAGFTLHDLRQMRAAGQLSDEEFEKARDAMITRLRSRSADADDTTSETVNTDVGHADDASADSGADPGAGR